MNAGQTPPKIVPRERRDHPSEANNAHGEKRKPHWKFPGNLRTLLNRLTASYKAHSEQHKSSPIPDEKGNTQLLDTIVTGPTTGHAVIDTAAAQHAIDDTWVGLQGSDGGRVANPTPPSEQPIGTNIPSSLTGIFPPEQPLTEGLREGEKPANGDPFSRDYAAKMFAALSQEALKDTREGARIPDGVSPLKWLQQQVAEFVENPDRDYAHGQSPEQINNIVALFAEMHGQFSLDDIFVNEATPDVFYRAIQVLQEKCKTLESHSQAGRDLLDEATAEKIKQEVEESYNDQFISRQPMPVAQGVALKFAHRFAPLLSTHTELANTDPEIFLFVMNRMRLANSIQLGQFARPNSLN